MPHRLDAEGVAMLRTVARLIGRPGSVVTVRRIAQESGQGLHRTREILLGLREQGWVACSNSVHVDAVDRCTILRSAWEGLCQQLVESNESADRRERVGGGD